MLSRKYMCADLAIQIPNVIFILNKMFTTLFSEQCSVICQAKDFLNPYAHLWTTLTFSNMAKASQ